MATGSVTGYKWYTSGWSGWSTSTLSGGYAGSSDKWYATILRIKTPSASNIKNTGVTITFPMIRQYNPASVYSGTLYMALFETDPAAGNASDLSSSNYDVLKTWSSSNSEYFTLSTGKITQARKITTSRPYYEYTQIKANTTYYLYICGSSGSMAPVQIGGPSYYYNVDFSYTAWVAGYISAPTITDNGKNKFKISCTATPGTNNKLSSLTIYYTSDGTTPTTSSSTIANDTYKTITSTKSSYVINAYAVAKFAENTDKKYSSASKTIYYHAAGAAASAPTVVDKGNNKATISGKIGKSVTNNAIQSATLYYTTDGSDPKSSSTRKYFTSSTSAAGNLVTTFASEAAYEKEVDIPKGCTVIKACLASTFAWGLDDAAKTQTSDVTVRAVQHHSSITIPTNKLDRLNIVDNGDNTFTIAGTDATSGDNNTATTSYQWGYSTSYGSSGKGTKILTIEDKTQATRTVYAKAVMKPSWIYDPNYNNGQGVVTTMSKDIKQYVVPSAPKDLKLNYNRARLTLEEPWTFTWTPSEAINSSSPLSGYFIMLRRLPKGSTEWEYIREINSSLTDDYISISPGSNSNENSNYFARRDNTSCTAIIQNPAEFGIKPGDKIKLRLKPFTFNGAGGAVQADGLTFEESAEYRIYETGVVDIKVDGEWTTGKVWVKQDDKWQKAKEIMVNVDGEWKYSQ
jgi:hypothetical protein